MRLMMGAAVAAAMAGSAQAEAATGLVLESAYAVPTPGEAAIYIVLNNLNQQDVLLSRATDANGQILQLHRADHSVFDAGITIPFHSELYMMPTGVHIAMAAPPPDGAGLVPIDLVLNGTVARIDALPLKANAEVPDHHNYHQSGR